MVVERMIREQASYTCALTDYTGVDQRGSSLGSEESDYSRALSAYLKEVEMIAKAAAFSDISFS